MRPTYTWLGARWSWWISTRVKRRPSPRTGSLHKWGFCRNRNRCRGPSDGFGDPPTLGESNRWSLDPAVRLLRIGLRKKESDSDARRCLWFRSFLVDVAMEAFLCGMSSSMNIICFQDWTLATPQREGLQSSCFDPVQSTYPQALPPPVLRRRFPAPFAAESPHHSDENPRTTGVCSECPRTSIAGSPTWI